MYVIKEEVDHFEEKIAKTIQIFLSIKGKTWIRILYSYVGTGSDLAKQYRLPPDPDPQNCPNMHIHVNSTVLQLYERLSLQYGSKWWEGVGPCKGLYFL
jgi:hypothetical protein